MCTSYRRLVTTQLYGEQYANVYRTITSATHTNTPTHLHAHTHTYKHVYKCLSSLSPNQYIRYCARHVLCSICVRVYYIYNII